MNGMESRLPVSHLQEGNNWPRLRSDVILYCLLVPFSKIIRPAERLAASVQCAATNQEPEDELEILQASR